MLRGDTSTRYRHDLFSLSAFEMCQVFRQLEKPSEAVEMLRRAERMVLRAVIIFAGGMLM